MLELNEKTHEYTLDGKVLPSVSEIMRPLSEAYYSDALRFNDLSEASDYGIGVHKAIEYYISFGTISDKYMKEVLAFIGCFEKERLEVIGYEMKLTNGSYCGTIDILAKRKPTGKVYLVDLKATSAIADPLLEVQLCAYTELLLANGKRIDGTYVLHLRKNGCYTYKPIAINRTKWKELYAQYTNKSAGNPTKC